tara:strand:+ start:1511 stop:1945 length:435 start_codon:yes stop_codon:yes gene_type:complete
MSEVDVEAYEAFLAGLRLRYFTPREITRYAEAARGDVKNGLPAEDLWENIVPTLWTLDQLRHYIKRPIRLTSLYRNEKYNKVCGGSRNSFHKQNIAIDFQVDGMSPNAAFNQLLRMRKTGCFVGGLGQYPTFTHVDTRGTIATW